ncbi:MAG: NUDIX domain-containing protein [Acidimicrobiia bacterium]|nr:NUDIX domain-containing protein [Acidimicrobiia bacterium]
MADDAVDEELVDELDAMGMVVGEVTRAEMRRENLLHRSVFIVVRNDVDELLIHRRAAWKDLWPDVWDIAVSGVVAAGEAWELAAVRELIEELGVSAELAYLGEGSYEDDDVREVARIYQARCEGPFDFSDNEIVEAVWVPIGDLRDWLEGRQVCPDSMSLVLPRLDAP